METPLFPSEIFKTDFESVYEPSEDTFLLIDAIEKDLQLIKDKINPLVCLEIGCGSGAVITSLAKALGPNKCLYLATDINEKALLTTQKCCSVNGIKGSIQLVKTDLTEALADRLSNSIDLIVFNPPYVPTPAQEVGAGDITSSWAGGLNGRQVIDQFLPTTPSLLSKNGLLYLIVIKDNNIQQISDVMKKMNYQMSIVLERRTGAEHLMALRFSNI